LTLDHDAYCRLKLDPSLFPVVPSPSFCSSGGLSESMWPRNKV